MYDCKNGLECKISVNTYKMFFVEDTEDVFRRRVPIPTSEEVDALNRENHAKFSKYLSEVTQDPRTDAPEWMLKGPSGENEDGGDEVVGCEVNEEERRGIVCRVYRSV